MNGRQFHHSATVVMSVLMAVIGVAMIIEAVTARGGGSISLLLVLGVLFIAAGAGRLYVERKRGRQT